MSPSGASSALIAPPSESELNPFVPPDHGTETGGAERRAHVRLTPRQLSARLKQGGAVTLIDVSVGGALVETSRVLRPDTELVLEFFDVGSKHVAQMTSRVLRSHIARIDGVIKYRGACVFSQPLAHPELAAIATAAAPLLKTDAEDFVKLEFALKAIVEAYLKRADGSASGRPSTPATLIDALTHVRLAAKRRGDPMNAHLADLLGLVIPAFARSESPDVIVGAVQDQLARQLPLLAIHPSSEAEDASGDRELITLSVPTNASRPRLAVTAEFPAGYALDEGQFRLLKAGSYLIGLVGERSTAAAASEPPPQPAPAPRPEAAPAVRSVPVPAAATPVNDDRKIADVADLPAGWHRVVVRYVDGQILRGYSNDFNPGREHLQVSSTIDAPAGDRLLVPLSRLKAVFFVKSLEGNPVRVDDQTFEVSPGARKVEITFRDGEVILGSTMSYKAEGQGFLLQPANSRGNNLRIFVVTGAVRHMRFMTR